MERGILSGITFSLSGDLGDTFHYISDIIAKAGARDTGSVTKQTTHLITTKDDVKAESTKVKRAKELGIHIVSLDFAMKSIEKKAREKESDYLLYEYKTKETNSGKRKAKDNKEGEKSSKKSKGANGLTKSGEINFNAVPKNTLPSLAFEKYWAKFSIPGVAWDKIKYFGNKEINARLDNISTQFDKIPYFDFHFGKLKEEDPRKAQLTENIHVCLSRIEMTTLMMKPEDDDYGIWKRYGILEFTFVNKKNPNLVLRTYAHETFSVTENIFFFDASSAIEILFADLDKVPGQWYSWIFKFRSEYIDQKNKQDIGGYPQFWYKEDELDMGKQAFPEEAEGLRQASEFLKLDEEPEMEKGSEEEEEEEEEETTEKSTTSTSEPSAEGEKSTKETKAKKATEPTELYPVTLPLLYAKACALLVQPRLMKDDPKCQYFDDTDSAKYNNFGYVKGRVQPFLKK